MAVAVLVGTGASPAAARGTHRASIDDGIVAALDRDRQLYLEAVPQRGEGLLSFSRRFCGTSESAAVIASSNGGTRNLLAGVRYRVPFAALDPEHQQDVIQAIFEQDFVSTAGWYHRVGAGSRAGSESLWHIAEWFTGRGENYGAIRAANSLEDTSLEPDQLVLVPARLLRPALRAVLPPDSPYYLEYGTDDDGDFAAYRLKSGEALYSSVVIRFTGTLYADDVNAVAEEVAAHNGIRDVTEIPVGYRVKIPFDLLEPEFLPASHPRRREYEAGLLASSRYSNRVTAKQLQGITVILDAGHGGSDVGASVDGVWESVYVYDILVRVQELLESTTAARVVPTIADGIRSPGTNRDVLPASRGHRILTDPQYQIEDSTVGLHLRWYLANSVYRRALASGADPHKTVFVSIHADSLHPSLRGAMVYIPGARHRAGSFAKKGPVYAARREYREAPTVSFSRSEREKSEGLSRQLANRFLASFEQRGLAVHPEKPIRDKVIRKRREWVPAVLRYNAVPAQVLLEVCNLANEQDRGLLQTRAYRQRLAEAIVGGIVSYYGDRDPGSPSRVVAVAADAAPRAAR